MLNYILTYVTLAVLFVFQTTMGIYIDIYGIAPNAVFVFAVCYSMYNFPVRSAVLCVIAGLLTDFYSGSPIGVNALVYMYTGLAISNFAGSLIKKNLWTAAMGVFVLSVLYQTILLTVQYLVPGYSSFAYPFAMIILPSALYDAVLSLVMSLWARWLSEERIRGI